MILIPLFSIILSVLLGTIVYLKNKESLPNKLFTLWMHISIISNVCNLYQSTAYTANAAASVNPIVLGTSFLYSSTLLLLVSALYYPSFIKTKKYLFPFLTFSVSFFIIPFIDYFMKFNYLSNGVALKNHVYTFVGGRGHFTVIGFHTIELILILTFLTIGFIKGKPSEKKQVVVIFIAYMITFISLSFAHNITNHLARRILIDFSTCTLTISFAYFIISHNLFSPLKAALDEAVKNMRDGLIVIDNEWKILRINKAANDLFNLRNNIINKSISEIFSSYPNIEKAVKSDEADIDCEVSSSSTNLKGVKSENLKIINLTKSKIIDKDGNVYGLMIIVKDITERKLFENEIKKAHEFLENLFNTSPDGIVVVDSAGKILKTNEAAARIYGFEKHELIGMHSNDFKVNDANLAKRRERFFKAINENGKIIGYETICKKKDGEIIPIELSSTQLRDKCGNNIGGVTIFRNISDRKNLEKEIVEKKEFLENIIETSPDGIVITKNGGEIIHANRAINSVSEYDNGELIGKHISIFNRNGDGPKGEFLDKLFKNGRASSHETILKTKNGNPVPVEWSVSLLFDQKGNRAGSMAIIRDIRSRKELEYQILQASKLAAIGELAASVAHELNNPLAGILGYAQLGNNKIEKNGIENLKQEDISKIAEYQKLIEKESVRCKNIVQNLLKFARKSNIELEPIDINSVIEETINFTKHQLDINKIQLIKNLQEDVPIIGGNASQLQQVFTNIIINAQKAMPDGGTLTVSTKNLNGNSGESKKTIEIEFKDTGCGIDPKHMEKIFNPFFTTRKIGEGTGLGLSVSYGIIKEHNGDIKVKSEPGKGTSFIINLPFKTKQLNDFEKNLAA